MEKITWFVYLEQLFFPKTWKNKGYPPINTSHARIKHKNHDYNEFFFLPMLKKVEKKRGRMKLMENPIKTIWHSFIKTS